MNLTLELMPTPAGLVMAGVAIAVGAPWFSDGLRAVRLMRGLKGIRKRNLVDAGTGLQHVHGQVALESPLFSPLSGVPCAGYALDVADANGEHPSRIETLRPFRLVSRDATARVDADGARLLLKEGQHRVVAAHEALGSSLQALLDRVSDAEARRRRGESITLVERVLPAGAHAHVVGMVRHSMSPSAVAEIELRRTGTDDVVETTSTFIAAAREPDLWINAGEHLQMLMVLDREPAASELRVAPARVSGILFGPLLTLAGMLFLAHLADQLRAAGRF